MSNLFIWDVGSLAWTETGPDDDSFLALRKKITKTAPLLPSLFIQHRIERSEGQRNTLHHYRECKNEQRRSAPVPNVAAYKLPKQAPIKILMACHGL